MSVPTRQIGGHKVCEVVVPYHPYVRFICLGRHQQPQRLRGGQGALSSGN